MSGAPMIMGVETVILCEGYAGWFAEHGSGFFFRALWQDAAVADALTARLRKTGAWRVIESLAT